MAHGHPVPFAGCLALTPTGDPDGPSVSTLLWQFENLTDENPRWEVTPGGAVAGVPVFPFTQWDVLETLVSTQFSNHRVLEGSLVQDATPGPTYFDLITILDLTLGTLGQTELQGQRDDHEEEEED